MFVICGFRLDDFGLSLDTWNMLRTFYVKIKTCFSQKHRAILTNIVCKLLGSKK